MKTTNLKSLHGLILCLFRISLFIYLRFIQKKYTYDLNELKSQVFENFLIINIGFTLLHVCLILLAIYSISIKNKNSTSGKFTRIIQKIANVMFINPFLKLRNLIAPHIPYSAAFFCKVTKFFEKKDLKYLRLPVIIFNIIPRVIVGVIFFIELTVYNRIYYFIFSISLLFIPLLWNIFVNLYVNFAERSLAEIPTYIEVIPIGEPLPNGWYTSYIFKPLKQFKYEPGDIKEYGDTFILMLNMYSFGTGKQSFRVFLQDVTPYVTIFTSSLYIFATIYKLIYVIF